ncbi:MAG TPA: isochorismatase family cysteine hydrolase [Rhizomicrobium sp.]|jgi:ureidoacrylate peracid hydrolase|nr:isochorismatase family cysteine hydrolase [Rhizomicrobium sp.]
MNRQLKDWIRPERTALLLIDMQVDFAAPEGGLGRDGMDMEAPQAAVREASRLAEAARRAGVACVFVRLITRDEDDTPFLREWKTRRGADGPPLCREGTRGAEFVGPQPHGGEMVFSKERYNSFIGTGLDAALRGEGIDTLVVAGLTTECCIDSSVRDAFERDYHVFVVEDATACYEPGLHAAAIQALALNCAQIVRAADVRDAWK